MLSILDLEEKNLEQAEVSEHRLFENGTGFRVLREKRRNRVGKFGAGELFCCLKKSSKSKSAESFRFWGVIIKSGETRSVRLRNAEFRKR